MISTAFLRGASACALVAALAPSIARAQQSLPMINIGAASRPAVSQPAVSRPTAARPAVSQDVAPAPGPALTPPSDRGGPADPTAYSKPISSAATKTNTPIMQTPAVVVVVPHQVLADQSARTIEDAVLNVSSVNTLSVGGLQTGFLIRGFENYKYYLDGVRVDNKTTPIPEELADIEQIDVMKGPASILYGRIEPGGLIALTTKKPLATPYHSIEQRIGSYGFYRTQFDSTGPLSDDKSLLYRLNVAYENAGSFRELDSSHRVFVSPRLRWSPTQDTDFEVYLRYLNGVAPLDFGTPNLLNADGRPIGVAPAPRSRNYGEAGSQLANYNVRAGLSWTHRFGADWSLTHRFDANFIHSLGDILVPFDAQLPCNGGCPVQRLINHPDNNIQSYVNTVELKGHFDTFGVGHDLLGGWEVYKDHTSVARSFNFQVQSVDLYFPLHTGMPSYLLTTPDFAYQQNYGQSWTSFYLQDQISLPYNVHVLAGFRHDIARTYAEQANLVPDFSVNVTGGTDRPLKPRVGLLWQPIPQLSLFGDYVEGFGVSNLINGGGSPSTTPLAPQQSRQWEGGVKVSLNDGRFIGTLAWFDIVKTNIPTPSADPFLAALGVQDVTGAVRNQGLDLDFSGQITPEFKVIGGASYINSKITADNSNNRQNIDHRFYGVPRYGANLWAVYEPQTDLLRGLALGAGFNARTNFALDTANSFLLPGYLTVNAMARYSFEYMKTKMSLQLNVNNLLDKTYYQSFGGGGSVFPGTPRTVMGSLKVEF
jgi:iron complex outermembrane recepter protein